jgi:hypothetical protein
MAITALAAFSTAICALSTEERQRESRMSSSDSLRKPAASLRRNSASRFGLIHPFPWSILQLFWTRSQWPRPFLVESCGAFLQRIDLTQNLVGVGGVGRESEVGLQVVDRLGRAAPRPRRLGGKISEFTAETWFENLTTVSHTRYRSRIS